MLYNNNFLFSEAFIYDAFKKLQRDTKESDGIFDNICSWYQEYKDNWLLYEDSALVTLGFEIETDGEYRWIKSSGKDAALVYLLDRDCMVDSTVKGKYYAAHAMKKAAERKVEWVIVTNGYEWRLLNAKGISPYEHFFSVDIKAALEKATPNPTTHVFTHVFGADFYRSVENGFFAVDIFKDKSDESEENIEDILRSKAESILTGLCYGLKDNMNKCTFTEEDKKQIYEDAIILLYRLLFLGYAEARKLLPVREDDPDYQDSFTKLCETAKRYYLESQLVEVGNNYDLWNRFDSQLRIYVDKNYNGGLFSNDDKPILKAYRIANKHMAPCLMELAYIAGRRKDYSQKIEYKDLSVRNLGSIYEGLLEYQLFIADELMVQRKSKGKVAYIKASETSLKNSDKNNLVQPGEIYLSQDAMERKETGAYYTPEDVVNYIVKNTVGKKLEELKTELDEKLYEIRDELSYEPIKARREQLQREIDAITVDFIKEKILSISIVDSAMGSGHFLVNAAYQISNYIVEILENNCWENGEINADVMYWRRKVVENCIYGIDINKLSVLLARLSLWLISATNDKALSFIDHHLKCGNSIVGTTTNMVRYINKDIPLYNMTKDQYMRPILKKYAHIKEIGSDTKAHVAMQHEAYEEINAELAVVKRKLDYYLASMYAGGITDDAEFREVMYAGDISFFDADKFSGLFAYADKNKFFHWELEFPEVFMQDGFDVAIGNPPYVDVQEEAYKALMLKTIKSTNLYAYMIENTTNRTKIGGYLGYIIPLSGFYTPRMKCFYDLLTHECELYISNYGVRPSKIFKNAEQRTSIFFGKKGNPKTIVHTTSYNRWHTNERKHLFRDMKYAEQLLNDHYAVIPKIGDEIEIKILEKIYSQTKRIENYEERTSGNTVYFHGAARYWLKALDFVPMFYNEIKGVSRSSEWKEISLSKDVKREVIICLINSSMFFWYWILMSDERHFSKKDITSFPYDNDLFKDRQDDFVQLENELIESYNLHSVEKSINTVRGVTKYQEFYPKKSKDILDKIDILIGEILKLSAEEVKYLINKDLRFRMGDGED